MLVLNVFPHTSTQNGSMRDAAMLVLEDLCFLTVLHSVTAAEDDPILFQTDSLQAQLSQLLMLTVQFKAPR